MCGITAVLLNPQRRSKSEWTAIRDMFTRNLVANEERGKEATGCGVWSQDGRLRLKKLPMAASRFVTSPSYLSLLAKVDSTTTLILGHTRLATRGDPAFAFNNHPLKAGPVFGVHNGHIDNADDLFAQHSLPRWGSVDSEIIFRFLETISPTIPVDVYLREVRSLFQLLEGQFTILACDQRRPGRLLVLKHGNPLYSFYHPDWNALLFSSRYVFLRNALGNDLPAQAIPSDQLLLFEAGSLPRTGIQPVADLPLY